MTKPLTTYEVELDVNFGRYIFKMHANSKQEAKESAIEAWQALRHDHIIQAQEDDIEILSITPASPQVRSNPLNDTNFPLLRALSITPREIHILSFKPHRNTIKGNDSLERKIKNYSFANRQPISVTREHIANEIKTLMDLSPSWQRLLPLRFS